MLKKNLLVIGLALVVWLNSSTIVRADDHQHQFIREVYSHSYDVPYSHVYVWGTDETEEGEQIPIYRRCEYVRRYHVLDVYCAYCDEKSPNVTKTVDTGEWEHDCPDGRK